MNKFKIDSVRVYKEGYTPNISPIDGHKYYEDKFGIRIIQKEWLGYEWWIKPIFDNIIIEYLSNSVIFICKLISEDKTTYSIISDNQNILFDNLCGVQRIDESDSFILNEDGSNSLIHFLDNGNYEKNDTSFNKIFRLRNSLVKEINSLLHEHVLYFGVIEQETELSNNSISHHYSLLDSKFVENENICYRGYDYRSPYNHDNGIILVFNHNEQDYKLLFVPNRGIVSKELSLKIEYLGKGDFYKILTTDNKWSIIDSFGSIYASDLENVGSFEGNYGEFLIFCKNGKYGAINLAGEILKIPLSDSLELHKNSFGAKSGYVKRNHSILDVLGNSFEVSFPSHQGTTESRFKPIIDDDCYSRPIGGGLFCFRSYHRDALNYSYIVNHHGEIIKKRTGGTYRQFYHGLFVFETNDGIYNVIAEDDKIIFSSGHELKIIEIPNFPIIAVKKKKEKGFNYTEIFELYNLNGIRIFENIENISDIKPFFNGNVLLGIESKVEYTYPVTVPIFDEDDDGNSYCEEYHTWDIDSKDVTLWGLYSINEKEILPREYYEITEDTSFNLIKISKICGVEKKGFFQVFGFADYLGNVLLKPLYETIEIFTSSLLRIKFNDRYGLMDYAFKQVIPCRYKTLEILAGNKFPFFKTENGTLSPTGLLIAQSEKARIILPRRICNISNFQNGLAKICNDSESKLLYGIINIFGENIIEDKYIKVYALTDKIYKCVNKYGNKHSFDLYYITTNLEATLIGSFDFISEPTDNSIGIGKRMNDDSRDLTYGVIDLNGNFILDICSSTLGKEVNHYRNITIAHKKGFIDIKTKRLVLIPDASYIGSINNGIASFAINSKKERHSNKIIGGTWGVINKFGEILIPPIYSKIFTDEFGRIYFKRDSFKIGVLNKEDEIIIPDEYDYLHKDTNENQIVLAKKTNQNKGTLFYFNNSGNLLTTEEYEEEEW